MMFILRNLYTVSYIVLTMFLLSINASILAKDFSNVRMAVDGKNSNISFATIKKQYIVEPATIEDVRGSIDNGKLVVKGVLDSIDTLVGIRNSRLTSLYFKTNVHPNIEIKATLPKNTLNITGVKRIKDVEFEVMLYGKTKKLKADIIASTTYKGLLVSNTKPIIVNANDFGIPADNLSKLSATVGGIPLSATVPVNFVLLFKE